MFDIAFSLLCADAGASAVLGGETCEVHDLSQKSFQTTISLGCSPVVPLASKEKGAPWEVNSDLPGEHMHGYCIRNRELRGAARVSTAHKLLLSRDYLEIGLL
ncbi:hypothetical protein [Pseudoclavibacter sp. RFBB5]|uniref:hypothetical protein n=1 Tax=Pseudoclavibacter sp. RFBB5 TaxID=2080574 RepID=UPI0011B0D3BA|nr:hypothetical protein [Pseudoclavibacter sp. RFBB5]